MLLYAYVLSFSNYISLLAEQTVSNGVVSSGTIWDFQSFNFLFEIVNRSQRLPHSDGRTEAGF